MENGNKPDTSGPVTPEALGQIMDRHADALELYARQLCDSPEDVVQDALVDLAARAREPEDVLPWLYRVVRNKAISAARRASRRRRHEREAADRRPAWFAPSAEDTVDVDTAVAALEVLTSQQREIVVAHVWGGLTFVQIGRLIGTSDSTAHRRYETALSVLRDRLGVPCPRRK